MERLAYQPPQLSREAYVRSAREGRSLGLGSGDLLNQACSQQQEASYSLRMASSGRMTLRLAYSQAPEHVEGEEQKKSWDPQVLQPMYWL
jgi:hypothetical protein